VGRGWGRRREEGGELMAPPPPSSLPAGLPASNSGGGEERERGRRGTRRGDGSRPCRPQRDDAGEGEAKPGWCSLGPTEISS